MPFSAFVSLPARSPADGVLADDVPNGFVVDGMLGIADAGVVSGEVVSGLVVSGEVVSGLVVSGEVVTGLVVSGLVVSGEVVTGSVVTGSVVTGEVVTGSVVTGEVVTREVVSGEVVVVVLPEVWPLLRDADGPTYLYFGPAGMPTYLYFGPAGIVVPLSLPVGVRVTCSGWGSTTKLLLEPPNGSV
jgi:hypothetical protein